MNPHPFAAVEIATVTTAALAAAHMLIAWARCQRRAAAAVERHRQDLQAQWRREERMRAILPPGAYRDPLSGVWVIPVEGVDA